MGIGGWCLEMKYDDDRPLTIIEYQLPITHSEQKRTILEN